MPSGMKAMSAIDSRECVVRQKTNPLRATQTDFDQGHLSPLSSSGKMNQRLVTELSIQSEIQHLVRS